MIRAAWMAQEILQTFEEEIEEVSLKPGKGGVFDVYANDRLVYSRKEKGKMPEITELKRLIRDRIAPGKSLGHSDGK